MLEVIREEQLLKRAQHIGRFMRSRLKGLQVRFPCIGEVRALGAMVAIELVKNCAPMRRMPSSPRRWCRRPAVTGWSCSRAACTRNVIRFLAPLTISDALLKEGFNLFESALDGGRAAPRCRPKRRPRPARGAQARPALASVGVWKYSLSEASCSIRRFSSAMRPCAVLIGMQS